MVASTLAPWASLPCSNAWDVEPLQKDVQLNSLTWSSADDLSSQRQSTFRKGKVKPLSCWEALGSQQLSAATLDNSLSLSHFSRCTAFGSANPKSAQGGPITTSFLTFSHITHIPSMVWSSKQPIPCLRRDQLEPMATKASCPRSSASRRVNSETRNGKHGLHQTASQPNFSQQRSQSRGEKRQPIKTAEHLSRQGSEPNFDQQRSQSRGERRQPMQCKMAEDRSRQGRLPENLRRSRPFVLPREAFEWQSAREEKFQRLYKAAKAKALGKLKRPRQNKPSLPIPKAENTAAVSPLTSPRCLFLPGSFESKQKSDSGRKENSPGRGDDMPLQRGDAYASAAGTSPRTPQSEAATSPGQVSSRRPSQKKRSLSPLDHLEDRTMRLVFWKFADGNAKIDRNRLGVALKCLGYKGRTVTDAAIAKCADQVSRDQNVGLTCTAFEEFCVLFDAEYTYGAVKSFSDADLDGNGVLTPSEVKILLEHHGITVIPGTVQELLDEVGQDCPGSVTIDEWEELVYIIRARGAFTQKEAEVLQSFFQRYDFNGNGKIDRRECVCCLSSLSLIQDKKMQEETLAEVMNGFDDYEDQEVVEPEFFQLVRKYRELEIKQISELFCSLDYGAGTLEIEGVLALLSEIGFKMPSAEVVTENARALRLSCETNGFFFDDVLMVADAFKKCEGFSNDELKEFRQVFDNHDVDQNGEIDAVELGAVLRWLGSPVDVERAQDLMEAIDMDKSGYVEFEEFLMVMRSFRESELESLERIYEASDADRSGGLNFQELKFLLLTLGYEVTPAHTKLISESFSGKEATFDECVVLINAFREELRATIRSGYGFNKKELSSLRRKFDRLDKHSNGAIDIDSIKSFVEDYSSDVIKMIPSVDLEKIIQRFDMESDVINFHEFLRFYRMLVDHGDYQTVFRQRAIAEEAGFNPAEVMEIRKIFKMIDRDSARSLEFHLLEHLLSNFMPATGHHIASLFARLMECDADRNSRIDFQEFIAFMRKIMDGATNNQEEDFGHCTDSMGFLDGLASHLIYESKREGDYCSEGSP